MGAFFSGTDDANENMTQFYAVWGRVMDDKPASILRYVVGKTRKIVPLSYLFDIPQVEIETKKTIVTKTEVSGEIKGDLSLVPGNTSGVSEPKEETREEVQKTSADYNGPWPELDYPDDWMGQHSKKYTASSTSYYGGSAYEYDGWSGGGGWGGSQGRRTADDYARGYYDRDLLRWVYPGDAAFSEAKSPGGKKTKKSKGQLGFVPDDDDDFQGGRRSKKGEDGLDATEDDEPVIYQNPIINLELSFGDGNDDTEANRQAITEALTQLSEDFVDGEIAYFKHDTQH